MKNFPSALCAVLLTISAVHAQPLVNIETVLVGDAGNATAGEMGGFGAWVSNTVTGVGSVAYRYRIGKFEVTIAQYSAFLNSVASTDPYGLYSPNMAANGQVAGVMRTGSEGSFAYSAMVNSGSSSNRPITYVSWFDAARFCNWLHNGATNGANTETGAYNLGGRTNGIPPARTSAAKYWVPTEDEWIKAAYYKGGGTNAGYWSYPTKSDSPPQNFIGNLPNQANVRAGVWPNETYSFTQSNLFSPNQNYLTDVGSYPSSASAYGTFDQAGNVREWVELPIATDVAHMIRGSYWEDGGVASRYQWQANNVLAGAGFKGPNHGFRVASISTPVTSFILTLQTGDLTNSFVTTPITADMITPDGKIDVGAMTSGSGFFQMSIEAVVK